MINKADVIILNTVKKINYDIILMYWNLWKIVFEYKEENNSRYGDTVVESFSRELSLKYGRGFGLTDIWSCLNFYNIFRKIPTSGEFENVTWSHCRELINIGNIEMIIFYLSEVNSKKLTVEELRKNLKLKSYERTIVNQGNGKIRNVIEKTLKDPLILSIENKRRTEKELEDMIIKNIFDNEINSYILVDLKINKVMNKDIFQMQMYIDYFNKRMKKDNFNNTVGIILCETKDVRVLTNDDIYQVKYLNEIPKEKELLKIINENKIILLKTEDLKLDK